MLSALSTSFFARRFISGEFVTWVLETIPGER
jgi:hypothetical protein